MSAQCGRNNGQRIPPRRVALRYRRVSYVFAARGRRSHSARARTPDALFARRSEKFVLRSSAPLRDRGGFIDYKRKRVVGTVVKYPFSLIVLLNTMGLYNTAATTTASTVRISLRSSY